MIGCVSLGWKVSGIIRIAALILVACPFLSLAPPTAHAATTSTVTTCDEPHLITAIASAGPGGTVNFACNGTIALTTPLAVSSSLTIDGSGQTVAISGGKNVQVVTVGSGVTFTLRNMTVEDGYTTTSGAAINNAGTVTISGSTLSSNTAEVNGGAIENLGALTVTNSTFWSNTADSGNGGAIDNAGTGTVTLSSDTFSNNSGVVGGALNTSGKAVINNTIVSGNSGGNCAGTVTDNGYNLDDDGTCHFALHAVSGSAQLAPFAGYGGATDSLALVAGSPAIGAGVCIDDNSQPVTIDQRGYLRHATNCDIGAFEDAGQPQPPALPPTGPGISDIRPNTVTAGSTFTLIVNGQNFAAGDTVSIGAVSIVPPPPNITATQITVSVPAGDLPPTGEVPAVTVVSGSSSSNQQPLYVTSQAAALSDYALGTAPATGGLGAGTAGSISATTTGGLVTIARYTGDPTGTIFPGTPYGYLDVHLYGVSTGLTFQDCNLGGNNSLFWLNAPSWQQASSQTYDAMTGCVTETVSGSTSPSIDNLSGTVFAAGVNPTGVVVSTCDANHLINAINNAGQGGTVTFACSGTITFTSPYTFTNDVTINGAGQSVTIDGGHTAQLFTIFRGVTVTLQSLTLANGSTSAPEMGAIENDSGTLDAIGVTFSGNVTNSSGGAIANLNGTVAIGESTFTANSATGSGGALYNQNGQVTVVDSTFSANTAGANGGAIENSGGQLSLTSSTLTANTAVVGGAVDGTGSGTVGISASTLDANAATRGGELGVESTTIVTDSIVANSTKGKNCAFVGATISDSGYNLDSDGSCGFTVHAVSGNPQLAPLGNNGSSTPTMALLAGSPALGAGTCTSVNDQSVTSDERTYIRHVTNCDIGAFETGAQPQLPGLPKDGYTVIDVRPNAVTIGSAFTLTIDGLNFPLAPVTIHIGAFSAQITPASSSVLSIAIPTGALPTPGAFQVWVSNTDGSSPSNAAPLYVTSIATTVSAYQIGDPASVGGTASGTPGSVTATVTGDTALLAQYVTAPAGSGNLALPYGYFDLALAGTTATNVSLQDCNMAGNEQVFWLNGSNWQLASQQSFNSVTGCATVSITSSTSPSISQLSGLVFVSGSNPTVAHVRAISATRKGNILTVRWRMAEQRGVVGFNLYAGRERLNGRLIRVHANPIYQLRIPYPPARSRLALEVVMRDGRTERLPVR